MDIFRTPVIIEESTRKISYHSKTIFLGSCFTENIGNKLMYLKFQVDVNPFGIIYNPSSLKNSLEILMNKELFTKEDLGFYNNRWFSFYHHSRFSNADADSCLGKINHGIELSHHFLKECNFLFITFGTAWVYQLKKNQMVVSNCHKIPASEFNRYLLKTNEIVEDYRKLLDKLLAFNPGLEIIFTVSPIRHWKDGASGNQVSKSTLIMAIHELLNNYPKIHYFPAYEIMMDDLRDYRFYAEDMIHPSQVAINYIWNRFAETYLDQESYTITKEIEKIVQSKNHSVFSDETEIYHDFIKRTLDKILILSDKYPFIDWNSEIAYFKDKMNNFVK